MSAPDDSPKKSNFTCENAPIAELLQVGPNIQDFGCGAGLSADELSQIVAPHSVDPLAIQAIVDVSGGRGGIRTVSGTVRSVILYEYHVFYRQELTDSEREEAVARQFAARRWGDLEYKATQEERYALLAEAYALKLEAAIAATNWGGADSRGELSIAWLLFC